MNRIEATQYIKATLTAFGPDEAISMTKETWAKLHEAMKELAEQPAQQEPVAWMHEWEDGERIPMLTGRDDRNNDQPKSVRPLVYGDTPQAQRKPLTDEFLRKLHHEDQFGLFCDYDEFEQIARAIEAAHGIKENA